jgi:3-amino-5-hydroxybenzoate synthase
VAEFEQSFAAYQQAAYGVSTFNGTVSLELALTVLGIGAGDEVIVPAISFVSTATAVSRVGATPVFVDIEPFSFNIDPERVREAITARTKVVMPVHFAGPLCNMDALRQICQESGAHLIEDAAHAHGSEWRGKRAGSFGIVGSFSFQNGKVLSSGEGGMLVTSSGEIAEQARSVANQGRVAGRSFYEHHRIGTNFRLTGFQAAVLLAQFERLPGQIETRTRNANLLREELRGVSEIVWQRIPEEVTQNSHYLLPGRLINAEITRDEFQRRLSSAGVPSTPFYPHTLYQNPVYQANGICRVMSCPIAEQCVEDAFWLPHRVLLADVKTIAAIAGVIRSALRG